MPYRLKPGRSVASELRRIADKQLALAITELRAVGDPRSDDAIHAARRRLKKVRAATRLVKPALGEAFHASNRRLRMAARMLGPVADGEAVIDTFGRVTAKYPHRLSRRSAKSIRAALVARSNRIDRKAALDRVLERVGIIVQRERRRLAGWTLTSHGFHAIAPGLEKSVRRVQRTMAQALASPTADAYHRWRRRTKDLWLQLRLLEGRCDNLLVDDQRRIEALDGCLGELHNIALLEQLLVNEPLLSRRQTAQCLRLLRRVQRQLRRQAAVLGRRISSESPRAFVRRIKRLWQAADGAAHRVAA